MKVKGSIAASLQKFVKTRYSGEYERWVERLSREAREIYSRPILATEWYPLKSGIIEPTAAVGDLFYGGDRRSAAWETGRFSAQEGLSGIYRVFVLVATPQYMMKRSGKILASFYEPSALSVAAERPKGVDIHITTFPESNEIAENRIGGWMERALEICGCRNVRFEFPESLARGDSRTVYGINWD